MALCHALKFAINMAYLQKGKGSKVSKRRNGGDANCFANRQNIYMCSVVNMIDNNNLAKWRRGEPNTNLNDTTKARGWR